MTRIRVLRIIARMNVGGPALQVVGLTRGLDTSTFETRLLTGNVEEGEEDYVALRAPGLELTRVEGLGRSIRAAGDARAFARLVAEMHRFRPHIVHTHTAKAGVLGRVAARICGVPFTVHTFHGHLLHGYFRPTVAAAVRTTERVLARSTDRLVAVGSVVRDELVGAGIGIFDQYVVVPPGVRLSSPPDRMAARRDLGLPQEAPVLAFVGRLTGVKRPDRMLDAVKLLSSTHPDIVVLIAGEGPLLHEVQKQAAGVRADVRFLGWRPDVETVYGAADLAVLTSDNEGMPVSIIEAAMCGLPAVVTRVGSAAEVVLDGKTGLVVDTSPEAVAQGMKDLLDDGPLRTELGHAARAHALAHFSVDRLVADIDALYRALVRG